MAEDFDQIRAAMEKCPPYQAIFSRVRIASSRSPAVLLLCVGGRLAWQAARPTIGGRLAWQAEPALPGHLLTRAYLPCLSGGLLLGCQWCCPRCAQPIRTVEGVDVH